MKTMIKVAIIGCGNIGTELACYLKKDKRFRLVALTDIDKEKIFSLRKKVRQQIAETNLPDAIKKSDLIIETANKEVVKEILSKKELDRKGKKLLVMSTGGLIEDFRLMKKLKNCQVHIPSGAIAGLDAIKAASENIQSLELKTTKSSNSLKTASFVLKNKLNLDSVSEATKIFEGKLKDAIHGFPQNINVAASLWLASRFDDLKISIIADPNTKFNTHEIICKGSFGEIMTMTKNEPSSNPKTSYLAILSAISTLKSIANNIKIGN